jgi:phage-related protein
VSFQIASAFVDVDADTTGAIRGVNQFIAKLTLLGPTAMAAGSGVAIAAGGMVTAFASAGAGLAVFAQAVKPQLAEVTNAADLYTKAQDAAAEGGEKAAAAQKAYNDALAKMPPATRDTARAFIGLRGDFDKWSDSLASTTMPIFTQGIGILRKILPSLTPLVKATATALGGFMDEIEAAVNGGAVDRFAKKLAETAGGNLTNLLEGAKNIAKGVGGIIMAFLPLSGQMSGGFAEMTARFAEWGQGLGQSQGFQQFVQYAQENGPRLLQIVGDLAKAVGNIVMALAPFTGATLLLAQGFAQIIANVPTPVLSALAGIITTLVIAMKLWSAAQAIVALRNAIWTTSQWSLNAALFANPMTWVVIGIVALIAAIVLIATKTDWFSKAWTTAWNWIKDSTAMVWDFIRNNIFQPVAGFFTETIPGWFNTAKDGIASAWNSVKTKTSQIWNGIKDFIGKAIDFIVKIFLNFTGPGLIIKHWDKIKSATSAAWAWVENKISDLLNGAKQIISSVTGAISSRISSIWGTIRNATSTAWNWIKGKISDGINAAKTAVFNAVGRISSTVSGIKGKVMGALSGAASWLKESGRRIIQGLIDGIKNMAGNVKDAIGGVLKDARNLLPFSPAKEGPFSGKGWTLHSGQSMMTGLAEGIDERGYRVKRSMEGALAPAQATTALSGPVRATPRTGTHIENLTVKVEGSFDMASPAQRRRVANLLAEEISDALRRRERERA